MSIALFLLDMVMDAWLLAIAIRLAGMPIKLMRVVAGALCGACIAWAAKLMQPAGWQRVLLWLPAAMLMAVAAAGERAIRRPLRWTGLVLCAAGLLGGIVQALHGALGSLAAAYALSVAACIWIVGSASRAARLAGEMKRVSARIRICCRGKDVQMDAVIDSGNTLRDYLTHRSVIVLPQSVRLALGLGGVPLRPIFADTAGGRQMMECFLPEETVISFEGKAKRILAAAAFSSGLSAGAPALVPSALVYAGDGD